MASIVGPRIAPPPTERKLGLLIDEESCSHHFGAVISKPGRKLKHAYRLTNTTGQDVKVLELVNRKPCCGEIRVGKSMLHPGDETEVEVTLSVRQEFGDITHETVVMTDPPQAEDMVLRTTATVYPSRPFEEVTPSDRSVLLSSDQPKRVEFRAIAYGSSSEPPFALDCAELRSTIKSDWEGSTEEGASEDGLAIQSRRFAARL